MVVVSFALIQKALDEVLQGIQIKKIEVTGTFLLNAYVKPQLMEEDWLG